MTSKRTSSPSASTDDLNNGEVASFNSSGSSSILVAGTTTLDASSDNLEYASSKKIKYSSAKSEYVALNRFEGYLKQLDLFYKLKCPILIEGPLGCGKSSLIEEFHSRCCASDSTPIVLNMGEQSDAKTLFGAFVTNPERPGEFCWKAGVILEALKTGRWLVIEDVDLASPEMIATIKGLLESESEYYVAPMGRSFQVHESFRLIATRRCESANVSSSSTAFDRLGRDLWQTVQMAPFAQLELGTILAGRFPRLGAVLVNLILNLFTIIVEAKTDGSVCTSLLFKFCSRVCYLVLGDAETAGEDASVSETLRQALLYEAVDCFASAWASRDDRRELALQMSRLLSLPETQVDGLYDNKPAIVLSSDRNRMSVGRATFTGNFRALNNTNTASSIALTTLTCQTLEKVAVGVKMNEPVLLVGETGTGKTTTVQHLAELLQFQPTLRVLNMSQQSEASDLLGGFKPFSAQSLARPLLQDFLAIFGKAFSRSKNGEYLAATQEAFQKQNWKRFARLVRQAIALIEGKETGVSPVLLERLKAALERFETQVSYAANNLLFSFVEGSLVEALTCGHWLLLDEINLATPDTLNILAGLLRSAEASVTLTERGDSLPVTRHPNFRLFACMNPATDVSKRDLPPAIRSRFTQIFVDETDTRREDLRQVIDHLIGPGRDGTLKERLTALYYRLKDLVRSFELVDGNGRKPLLNLRTLTRPIKFARACESIYGLERALYEGWCLSFTTMLDETSAATTRTILQEFLMPATTTITPLRPFTSALATFAKDRPYIIVEGYTIFTGPQELSEQDSASFVLTPSVKKNVAMLARAVMARNYPVLLEGPTSAGKTSVIEYLAHRTGHHFVRINNHEHTDIQEYLGSYVSDPTTGRLVFKEGILVQALRRGHWLVLDELNLAPSDILEALNRLLDDNRELFLPETGETIKPHPDFHLFATQNPAGAVYGGRKALSRAFRSRFLELQFTDLPLDEVEQILSSRCSIAPSFARRIAQVYRVLQERRSTAATNIFAGKNALVTLRDCFRWAQRHSHSAVGSTKELAQDGYFVLAERCRHPEEAKFIRETLEKVCKAQLDPEHEMYNLERLCSERGWTEDLEKLREIQILAKKLRITWTRPIQRLFTLVYLCIRFREPVILVGETGCGKTTVCQLLAQILHRSLRIVNCHANSESGDFLGSFRPIRTEEDQENGSDMSNNENNVLSNKLFQWTDGPLVEAMTRGDLFLLDEISLADDSVLERLNSVLEPSRYLLLAECTENDEARVVSASDNFSILATMNPGGDFGKKELSPALRNRFTEIWVPTIGDRHDLRLIISSALNTSDSIIDALTEFWYWWQAENNSGTVSSHLSSRIAASLRDLLGWLSFATIPALNERIPSLQVRLLHGAAMIFTDRLGSENNALRVKTLEHLANLLQISNQQERLQVIHPESSAQVQADPTVNTFSIGPFSLPIHNTTKSIAGEESFAFEAPTTRLSALRVLRALQGGKAVLLEGSPGVGKTTLIGALAAATGNQLTRINLSEQTDLVDLFGADLPVDGGSAGRFRWADGPFLQALKRGDWILLDELNLASQSVLEGLNACLDHRATVFIPELNREFHCNPGTRIFAAQNPAGQGGGRKGLPKSFLNRFTVVWFDSLVTADYQVILEASVRGCSSALSATDIGKMIKFNESLNSNAARFSSNGRPWEFNLRDLSRWVKLIQANRSNEHFSSPIQFIRALYASRFRCEEDFQIVGEIVESIYGPQETRQHFHQLPQYDVIKQSSSSMLKFIGKSFYIANDSGLLFLRDQLCPLEAALMALEMGWLCILTGPGASGKSALIDSLAALNPDASQKKHLRRFFVSPDTDTLELLGSFEQVDFERRWNLLLEEIKLFTCIDELVTPSSVTESTLAKCPQDLKTRVKRFIELCKDGTSSDGRFEWVDGPLVRAMTLGQWLVLENVNLASSAVLDRLNSLFEPNGSLVLSEQGCSSANSVRIIRPAPGFRLFMTVDPKFGEISRAMRNRGIEIACFPRNETRVLDDLQIIRTGIASVNDERTIPLLQQLLPLKPSRRLLHRIACAASICPDSSVEDLLKNFISQSQTPEPLQLSSFDSYWLQNNETMPYLISAQTFNVPAVLQSSMIKQVEQSMALSTRNVALLSLFVVDMQVSSLDTDKWNINFANSPNDISQLELLTQIVLENFNLSPEQIDLLHSLKTAKNTTNLVGYLTWIIAQNQFDLKPYEPILRRMLSGQLEDCLDTGLGLWVSIWRHFGFKNELCAQIYLKLRQAFESHSILNQSDAIHAELVDALETVLSTKQLASELLAQLEKFSHLVSNHANSIACSSTLSRDFLAEPKTLIFLNKIGSFILKRIQAPSCSISIPRSSLSQEWLSQVWSLVGDQSLNFFSGFDGLGNLLENANRTWNLRTTKDELELMSVFDNVLKFVVQHGGKDKRAERLHLLKGLFNSKSESSASFARDLVSESIGFLENSSALTFDPVADHFQVNQRALSTEIQLYSEKDQWSRIYNTAYLGSSFIVNDSTAQIHTLSEKITEIQEFVLVRPEASTVFAELASLCSLRLCPLLSQAKNVLENSLSSAVQCETLQMSLLRVRTDLLADRFVLFRDITAPFIQAIDRLKVGLYLIQIDNIKQSTSASSSMLPLGFISPHSIQNWSFTASDVSKHVVSDSVSLHLSRFIPSSDSILREMVLPVLARTLEHVHDELKAEVARNQKNDSVFVFKGSNNDDDALDAELSSELFGDFEKKRHNDDDPSREESDDEDVEMSTASSVIEDKRVNYGKLSADLYHICSGIAGSNDSSALNQISEIISRAYEFIGTSVNLSQFADGQIYRMLIWTLSEKLSKRRSTTSKPSSRRNIKTHYDFYRDACPEGRLQDALGIIQAFYVRIESLLLDWPEHDVLQSLQRQLNRFFALPVNSTSMIEALLSLEKLYLRSQDWEKYAASSQTCLGQCVADLLHLIVEWRRAEVENWKGLLDAVVLKMESESLINNGEWLSMARVALSSIEGGDREAVDSIISLIDTFMLAAPVGQFSKRLEILEFCSKLSIEASAKQQNTTANAFATALLYYQNTLAHRVQEYVRVCREPVERDLSAFLMTLYWKDINYWSVRQMSEKSHRHLARMVRKWKESMQMPLSSLLNQLTIKAQIQLASMENPNVSKKQKQQRMLQQARLASSSPIKPLTSLGLKVKGRLEAVNYSVLAAGSIEAFGTSILETLNELKESTEASIQPKQKAFVDLIRELKVFGIRINRIPSAELLAAKPILCSYAQATNLSVPRDERSEYYLIRTLEKWQKLASAVAHEDITFRQAEIIKNSVAYLIEVLVCGQSRAMRDAYALEAAKIHSLLENLSYRQNLSSPVTLTAEAFETFKGMLWKAQVAVSHLSVLFDSHRLQNISSKFNWSVLVEIFALTKSTVSEVSNLLDPVKCSAGLPVCMPLTSFDRISLVLSSLVQSVHSGIDDTLENSGQVSDLTSEMKNIINHLSMSWNTLKASCTTLPELSSSESDVLIRKLLLSIQVCENEIILPESASLDEYSFYPDYLRKQAESSVKAIASLSDSVIPAMEKTLGVSSCPVELVEVTMISAHRLLNWIESLVLDHYRQLSRLTLILSNVFLHLYQEGFCRPPPAAEDAASAEDSKDGKLSEGMGIGEGEGEKNVSKEIEFEEQVTGTLDEKDEPAPNKKDKDEADKDEEKDGDEDKLDMSQDFDGQLEDLMNDDKEDEKEEENNEEDEDIPMDQMKNSDDEDKDQGNQNEDEQIQDLDPSWWNSEDENESDEDVEAPPDSENQKIADNEKNNKEQEKAEKDSKDPKTEQTLTAGTEDSQEQNEVAEEKELSGNEDEGEEEENSEEQDIEKENSGDVEMENCEDDAKEALNEEADISEDEDENLEETTSKDVEMDAEPEEEVLNEDSVEPVPTDEKIPEDAEQELQNSEDAEQELQNSEDEAMDEKDETNAANNNQNGHDDLQQQQETESGETSTSMQMEESAEQQTGSESQVKTFDNIGASSAKPETTEGDQSENQSRPESSDQIDKWKRTVNRILNEATESKPVEDADKLTREQQYEQAANPDDENALTVKAEAEEDGKIGAEDDENAAQDKASLEAEESVDAATEEPQEEPAKEAEDLKLVPHLKKSASAHDNDTYKATADKELEQHLMQLSLLPSWPEYEHSTSDLAFDLCEQLRLVLAPTLATKLRGDYRTGKRLNLRKILPYIASQYRRDKIWLRRTKPSQRNYRLCLSIDNSKSMMETGSVGLAFEAIATISQALERLEVGELALIGFGDQSRVLQPFASGVAKVSLGQELRSSLLKFDEDSTDIPTLLESVLDTFASAPTSNSAPVWQLNVILSDGICHHHDRIKPLLARCHSARILNIFVLLDSRPIESSIFELSHVEYVDQGIDPMTGQVKTAIKMTKYLETFPFEFYVVLRDVKMLPSVLAESLKQWFELISLQEGEH